MVVLKIISPLPACLAGRTVYLASQRKRTCGSPLPPCAAGAQVSAGGEDRLDGESATVGTVETYCPAAQGGRGTDT